ncbi:hypothetical protein CC86DRAFT_404596 [Ophiobolus disseminans]|uniref:Uncharacterized protein n=1 Tax=Ophiobolus disseminans TaxID=1469910 RepID=A0A6A7A7I2_9PLEO|nr:hypothetical protein CC86DRAFT_404596 [Ophiobolus disseminans]
MPQALFNLSAKDCIEIQLQGAAAFCKRHGLRTDYVPLLVASYIDTVSPKDQYSGRRDVHHNPDIAGDHRSSSHFAGIGFQAPAGGFGHPQSVNGSFYDRFPLAYAPKKTSTSPHLPKSPHLSPSLDKTSTIQINGVDVPGFQLPGETMADTLRRMADDIDTNKRNNSQGRPQHLSSTQVGQSSAQHQTDADPLPVTEIISKIPNAQPAAEPEVQSNVQPDVHHTVRPLNISKKHLLADRHRDRLFLEGMDRTSPKSHEESELQRRIIASRTRPPFSSTLPHAIVSDTVPGQSLVQDGQSTVQYDQSILQDDQSVVSSETHADTATLVGDNDDKAVDSGSLEVEATPLDCSVEMVDPLTANAKNTGELGAAEQNDTPAEVNNKTDTPSNPEENIKVFKDEGYSSQANPMLQGNVAISDLEEEEKDDVVMTTTPDVPRKILTPSLRRSSRISTKKEDSQSSRSPSPSSQTSINSTSTSTRSALGKRGRKSNATTEPKAKRTKNTSP